MYTYYMNIYIHFIFMCMILRMTACNHVRTVTLVVAGNDSFISLPL